MSEFDEQLARKECVPESLRVSELGWPGFLEHWDKEYLYWFKKSVLKFGWHEYSQSTEAELYESFKNNWKRDDYENAFQKYLPIFGGGIDLPSINLAEPREASERWEMIRDYTRELVMIQEAGVKEGWRKPNLKGEIIAPLQVQIGDQLVWRSNDAIALNNGLSFKPATHEEIEGAEFRLTTRPSMRYYEPRNTDLNKVKQVRETIELNERIELPPSYKAFLLASNGWIYGSGIFMPAKTVDYAIKEIYYREIWANAVGEAVNEGFDGIVDDEHVSYIPNSLILNVAMESVEFFLMNFSDKDENGEWKVPNQYVGETDLNSLPNFEDLMEKLYVRDVTSACLRYSELQHRKDQGEWKSLDQR